MDGISAQSVRISGSADRELAPVSDGEWPTVSEFFRRSPICTNSSLIRFVVSWFPASTCVSQIGSFDSWSLLFLAQPRPRAHPRLLVPETARLHREQERALRRFHGRERQSRFDFLHELQRR